jgi:predicted TIM-barrel fold metal-dependent hydrolase
MIIDIYTHILPDTFFREMARVSPKLENIGARLRGVKKLFDLDLRFAEMDMLGDYRQIISLPNPPLEEIAGGKTAQQLSRVANDAMAELVAQHPKRFPAFVAAVALDDVDAALKEAERAIKQLDARGIQIFTNIAGHPLDEERFKPVFAMMAAHKLPIWLHPARNASMPDYASEQKSRFEMWWCFGWPYETSVAMARLVFSGVFDRHPALKIVTHHLGGGMIPFFDGRIGAGMEVLGSRTSDEDYSKVLSSLKRPHLDYFREFYADTALFGAGNGLACGLDFFGAGRVVFSTDAPLGPIAKTIAAIDALDLDPGAREKIMRGNAERLLKMDFGSVN